MRKELFSKALLERLKGLVEKDVAYASKEESKLTPLASSIVVKLTEQLDAPEHCEHTSTYVRIKDFHLRELIKLGEDFLSIFDK